MSQAASASPQVSSLLSPSAAVPAVGADKPPFDSFRFLPDD